MKRSVNFLLVLGLFVFSVVNVTAFSNDRSVDRIPADYPSIIKLLSVYNPPIHDEDSVIRIADLMQKIEDKKVVMVGEIHNQFEQHLAQLAILKAAHHKKPDAALAIEWIQAKYQSALDAFMRDEIDLLSFIEQTDYEKAWGYDIRQFLPILEYAKQNKISVYAIDVGKELVKKIYHHGMKALSKEEKSMLPEKMVALSAAQQSEIEQAMRVHQVSEEKIQNLVLAQRIRDAAMTENVLKTLEKGHSQVIVLAGINHVLSGRGMSHVFDHKLSSEEVVNISIQTAEQLKNRYQTSYVIQSPLLYLASF